MSYASTSSAERTFLKIAIISVCCLVTFLILGWIGSTFVKSNDIDKIQIGQSLSGDIVIRREGGLWWGPFYKTWSYPKACSYYFSNDNSQSKDHDAPMVQFSNTGTGELNCQVVYRIDGSTDEVLLKLHQIAHGDDTIIEQRVLSTLNTVAQSAASKVTSTDVIKRYDEFYAMIKKGIVHNTELKSMGIDVEDFVLAGKPKFDPKTEKMFEAQKEADLLKQTAEAEKLKLISEKEKAIAQYEKEMAENEGKAKAQMAKEVTDAEREKKLAEIAAQKQVEVEKLEKEKLLVQASKEKEVAAINVEKEKAVAKIEAEKLFEVAEIAKKTEAENLERVKLQAEQKVAEAKAKKEAIALAGEITETERTKLEFDLKKETVKWESIGKGIGNIKLPQMMNLGTGSTGTSGSNALDNFFQLLCLEKGKTVAEPVIKK